MRSSLDWDKFKIFYHVAQAGSFTRAADILKITQPSLSRTIQSLEEQIATKLFNRTAKGVTMTSEGQVLYQSLNKIYREFIQSELYLQNLKEEVDCVLKVGILRSMATAELIEDLTGFMVEYPSIRLNIIQLEQQKEISDYKVDIALLPSLNSKTENLEWVEEYLCTLPQGFYASPDYIKHHGHPKSLTDLKSHRFVLFDESPDLYPSFLVPRPPSSENEPDKSRAAKKLRSPHYCINSCEGMRQGAEKGYGITVLYGQEDRILQNSSLMAVKPDQSLASLGLNDVSLTYAYPSYSATSQRVKNFGEYLKKVFKTSEDKVLTLSKISNSNVQVKKSSNIRPFKGKDFSDSLNRG